MSFSLPQALQLHQSGQLDKAEAAYKAVLSQDGRNADALFLYGVLLAQKGAFDRSETLLKKAVKERKDFPDAWYNLATLHLQRSAHAEAEQAFKQCLASQPQHAGALWNLGNLFLETKQTEQAEQTFRNLLRLQPGHPEALHSLALSLTGQRRLNDAADILRPLLETQPTAKSHALLGQVLFLQSDFDPAEAQLRQALSLDPSLSEAKSVLSGLLRRIGRLEEALSMSAELVAALPNDAVIRMNFCLCLKDMGRYDEALREADAALKLDPQNPDLRKSRAHLLLQMGRLEEGWRENEFRFTSMLDRCHAMNFPFPRLEKPEQARNQTVLLWPEQGIGDNITFSSAIPDMIDSGGDVEILAPAKLFSLFQRSFSQARVIKDADQTRAQLHAPLGDLFKFFRPNLSSFPGKPFLVADAAKTAAWRERFVKDGAGPFVGLGWKSTMVNKMRQLHFFNSLSDLAPFLSVPGVTFVITQPQCTVAEVDAVRERFGCRILFYEDLNLYDDLDEAAAMMKALDLVISNGSANALLAAALGVPVWMFFLAHNHWDCLGTHSIPWLGSLSIFERNWNEDWSGALDRTAQALRACREAGRVIAPHGHA